MTTTKKDLALRISEKLGVKKQLAYEVVDTLFKAMRESLIQGNRIEIRGFGVLGVKDTKPKPAARNPRKTGVRKPSKQAVSDNADEVRDLLLRGLENSLGT